MKTYALVLVNPSRTVRETFYLTSRPGLVDVATVQFLRSIRETYHNWEMVSRTVQY